MTGPNHYKKNPKMGVEVAIVAGVFAILLYNFEKAAQRCGFLDVAAWAARELLHSLVVLAWQSGPSYFVDLSKISGHLTHIVTSICPLFGLLLP